MKLGKCLIAEAIACFSLAISFFYSKCENREVICQKYFCSNKSEQINQFHMQKFSDISLTAKLSSQELLELKITILIVFYVQYESRKSTVPIVNVREEYLAQVPLGMYTGC